ncbi:protein WVD2-like 7 [Raphanus sativus]|nr:protein WVD2-like 7 [Raphanus sativus]
MGESAVLFHSYSFGAPPLSRNVSHQDNTNRALSQSVSFGRFTTENLEWGKWSSFSHNKYVDEAEKYSQPGSVAQKKAFFDRKTEKKPTRPFLCLCFNPEMVRETEGPTKTQRRNL